MRGYSITKRDINTTNLFWEKLDQISDEIPEFNSLYSKETANYFEKKNITKGIDFRDLSFILNYDDKPIAAYLGNVISNDNDIFLKYFEF